MNKYELTVVLPEVTEAKKKAFIEKFSKYIEGMDGKVGKIEDWGVKDLAYKIKKQSSGSFLNFPLELNGDKAKQIEGKLRVDEDVIRHLLIKSKE